MPGPLMKKDFSLRVYIYDKNILLIDTVFGFMVQLLRELVKRCIGIGYPLPMQAEAKRLTIKSKADDRRKGS